MNLLTLGTYLPTYLPTYLGTRGTRIMARFSQDVWWLA
jgi:hypothetical protein